MDTSAQRVLKTMLCGFRLHLGRYLIFERQAVVEERPDPNATWEESHIHKVISFDIKELLTVDLNYWHEPKGVSFYYVDVQGCQIGRFETFPEASRLQIYLLSLFAKHS